MSEEATNQTIPDNVNPVNPSQPTGGKINKTKNKLRKHKYTKNTRKHFSHKYTHKNADKNKVY
jgi:hypothetical protein